MKCIYNDTSFGSDKVSSVKDTAPDVKATYPKQMLLCCVDTRSVSKELEAAMYGGCDECVFIRVFTTLF